MAAYPLHKCDVAARVRSRSGVRQSSCARFPRTRSGFGHHSSAARQVVFAKAGSSDFEAAPTSISAEEAYKILGVDPATPFEDIMEVKNKLLETSVGDGDRKKEIDAAYDALLFVSMKRRLSGEAPVASSVRFADVPKKKPAVKKSAPPTNPVLKNLPKVQLPRQSDITTQAAVFGSLATWALLQALLETPDAAATDVAGWQLALAATFAVYSYKETKKVSIGRALGLTAAALLVGAVTGGLLEGWLRVDIVPIGGFSSPGVLVGEFAIFAVWAACTILV